jgi:putative addiction module killer protein
MQLLYYVDADGQSPFSAWFDDLAVPAAAKVTIALKRLEEGNTSRAKSVGEGIYEIRIDFGPGYRIYYGYDGKTLVILLAGGTKQRQQQDIKVAKQRWVDYKERKG